NYSDETVVRFVNGATTAFDGNYDAWKLFSQNQQVPSIYTQIDSTQQLSINAYPQLDQLFSIDLHLVIHAAGNYTIQPIMLGAFAPKVYVVMQDLQTGNYYNMKGSNTYSFQLPLMNTSSPVRFRMVFSVPAYAVSTSATCAGNDGNVTVIKPGDHNWSYFLQDVNNNVVAAGNNVNESDTITGLGAGYYYLLEVDPYGGSVDTLLVNGLPAVTSSFSVSDSLVYTSNATVYFSDASQNASIYSWDFGDNTSAQGNNVSHTYTMAGTYTVTLYSSNGTCSDASQKVVTVINDLSTGIHENNVPGLEVMQQPGLVIVEAGKDFDGSPLQLNVFDVSGRLVLEQEKVNTKRIEFTLPAEGIYFIRLSDQNNILSRKIIFTR
ncbi:MAG TPA: PKD domain-containing protein, partial [Bacteroidia bacterium]